MTANTMNILSNLKRGLVTEASVFVANSFKNANAATATRDLNVGGVVVDFCELSTCLSGTTQVDLPSWLHVPARQFVRPGNYADSVVVTVTIN